MQKYNTLFIGPYKQNDGWGRAAREYIKAIASVDNIKTIPITTNNSVSIENFDKYDNVQFDKYDAVIQNCLPNNFTYDKRFGVNIGLWHDEVYLRGLDINKYNIYSNLLDCIIKPGMIPFDYDTSINIPVPTDINKFNKSIEVLSGIPQNTINFYTVGELVERKNLDKIIVAFHLARRTCPNINLVIKAGNNYNGLILYINNVKKIAGLYSSPEKYPKEIIINGELTDEQMLQLHRSCHCFINASSGESHCMPMLDAYLAGNYIISSRTGFINQFNTLSKFSSLPGNTDDNYIIKLEDSTTECAFYKNKPLPTFYTSNEYVNHVSISNLHREIHTIAISDFAQEKNTDILSKEKFSYNTVGTQIHELITKYIR